MMAVVGAAHALQPIEEPEHASTRVLSTRLRAPVVHGRLQRAPDPLVRRV